jgi:hypothetical protein
MSSDSIQDPPELKHSDKYGFLVNDALQRSKSVSQKETDERNRKEIERTKKWTSMIQSWNTFSTFRQSKLKNRIRKGPLNC